MIGHPKRFFLRRISIDHYTLGARLLVGGVVLFIGVMLAALVFPPGAVLLWAAAGSVLSSAAGAIILLRATAPNKETEEDY